MKGIYESVEKLTDKNTFEDSDILNLFQIEKTNFRKLKIYFSESLKGSCMTIHSPTKASMTGGGGQRMILLEPALSRKSSVI